MTTKQRFRNGKYRIEVREKDHALMHVYFAGGGLSVYRPGLQRLGS